MEVFDELGLDDDADERAIKRACAQRLKGARPDVDPEGFQILHAAYQEALSYARRRAADPDDDDAIREEAATAQSASAVLSPPAQAPAPSASQPMPAPREDSATTVIATAAPFDFDAFYDQLIETAAKTDAPWLSNWLTGQSTHWSLAVKSEAGWRTLATMRDATPSLTPAQFDAVIGFFGFDDVLAGADPIALFHLRSGIENADFERRFRSELDPANKPALIARMAQPDPGGAHSRYRPAMTRIYMGLLRQPFATWWAFPLACWPLVARRVAAFIAKLGQNRPELLSPQIDVRHITFWPRAQRGQATNISRSIFYVRFFAFVALIFTKTYLDAHDQSRFREFPPKVSGSVSGYERDALGDPDYKLYLRGNALQADRKHQAALQIFDDILARRSPTDNQFWVGRMMTDRVFALAGLQRFGEMIIAVDRMDFRFGDSKDPLMQAHVTQALLNKAGTVSTTEGSLAVYDDIIARFDTVTTAEIQERLARAHFWRGNVLYNLGRYQDAMTRIDHFLARFGELNYERSRSYVHRALLRKAECLVGLDRRIEAVRSISHSRQSSALKRVTIRRSHC